MSKPPKHYRPDVARRTRDIARLGLATCETCGKKAYVSKAAAKRSARVIHPGQRLRVYPCGDWWHLTSQDAETTERMRERDRG